MQGISRQNENWKSEGEGTGKGSFTISSGTG